MHKSKVFIISGRSGQGKTTLLKLMVEVLKKKGLIISGFYAEGKWEENSRSNHRLVNISDNSKIELCTTNKTEGWQKEKHFYFNPEAIKFGNKILKEAIISKSKFIVIDEIGHFELQGKIWASAFEKLLKSTSKTIVITVKPKLVNPLIIKFGITDFIEIPSNTTTVEAINIIGIKQSNK